jgi:hypothetical protein
VSSTREYRNAGAIEDAVAAIGATITVTEHLLSTLASVLPDDFPTGEFQLALGTVRETHNLLGEVLGV